MINFIAIPLELRLCEWIKLDGSWVFNTEYGHIHCNFRYGSMDVKECLMAGIKREWPADVKDFDRKDKLLMMFAIDELIDRGLPHYHIGIYLRFCEAQ